MKRYASCYCRYSSDKQQQQSIEYQLERIEEFCQKQDITLIEKYIDEATTGTNDQRSDFQRMIQDSEHSKWGYLLVYNLSRLARNVEDQMFYQKILKQRGIMIISVEEKFDSSPEGHLFALITAGINEYYSKHLAKRSFAGVMQNAKKGLATGGVPPLGFGFRVGFLGLLHMEIFQERLDREFNQNVIATAPSVNYRVAMNDKSVIDIDNPAMLPDLGRVHHIEEPYVKATIITPSEYVGNIMELCQRKRGTFKDMQYISTNRVELIYDIPLSEIIFDFFDKLKSSTKGYASLDYELSGYKESKLVKLDILLNSEPVNALTFALAKYKNRHYDEL